MTRRITIRAIAGAALNALVGLGAVAVGVGFAPILSTPDVSTWYAPSRLACWAIAAAFVLGGLRLVVRARAASAANSALALGVSLLCVVGCEYALAYVGVEPAQQLSVEVPPLAKREDQVIVRGEGTRQLHAAYWRTNSDGFGDPDEFVPGDANGASRRVMILGDSFAFGLSATLQEFGFGELLERFLDATTDTVVWNTGMPGKGLAWQLDCLQRWGGILRPQFIVSTLFANDYSDALYPVDQYYVFKGGERVVRYARLADGEVRLLTPHQAYVRAHAPQTPHEYLMTLRTATALDSLLHQIDHALGAILVRPNADLGPGAPEVERVLREIRATSESLGATLIVLLIPERLDTMNVSQTYRASRRLCSEIGPICVDPLPELTRMDYRPPPNGHWRDTGHAKAADLLVEVIEYRSGPRMNPDESGGHSGGLEGGAPV